MLSENSASLILQIAEITSFVHLTQMLQHQKIGALEIHFKIDFQ